MVFFRKRLYLLISSLGVVFSLFSPISSLLLSPRPYHEKLLVSGITEPIEVIRDKWGIPHIFARNEPDLFFAQGFVAATDRLFQLELWRRQATGTLSEAFGRRFLQTDIGNRLLRFRGNLKTELDFYHPRGEKIINSFVAGINAYIDYIKQKPTLLPDEFRWLGFEPSYWSPEEVISRHNGLFRNASEEIAIAQSINYLGPKRVEVLLPLKPLKPDLSKEIHLDLSLIREDILSLYRAARSEINFLPSDIVDPEVRAKALLNFPDHFQLIFLPSKFFVRGKDDDLTIFSLNPSSFKFFLPILTKPDSLVGQTLTWSDFSNFSGSNNWVLAGWKTISGQPLLANDPHRILQIPSLRSWVHLVAPGWNVIGGGEPALPGIAIGHNDYGAWGLTIFATDQEDLYVYSANPEKPDEYLYEGKWEKLTIIKEIIKIKNESPVEIELKFTRHGPVLYEDRANHLLWALRASWLEIGCAPYLASLRINQAKSWKDFRQACRFFRTPSENLIWADRQGNIGWQVVGLAPKRKNFTGLLPVPGDGRFEWEGFIDPFELPYDLNPREGFIATANECNLPANFPYPIGFLWAEPFRSQRIREVLSSKNKFDLKDMISLQLDVISLPARQLVALLKPIKTEKESLKKAIDKLLTWDFSLKPDSEEAALYVTWQQALLERVWQRFLPKSAYRVFPRRSLELTINCLLHPSADLFGSEPEKIRDELLLSSLEEALSQLQEKFGTETNNWVYGHEKFHHVLLRHPLSQALKAKWRSSLDIGPLPRGGDANTVLATSGFNRQTSGATFRLIADLSNWDNSVGTNCPGQSGDYRSPHYADLFKDWAEGIYFPIYFSRKKILEAAEKIIHLLPFNKLNKEMI
ncbi:MAG: penicillin acylase family protein [Candidatus Aminicenantes bacterium]|nr:penicillin acylase family protein [Candidatus Aminicenantes bacterium]